MLKAIVSKHRVFIFYPKKRNEPYKTLSLDDALVKAESFFPTSIHPLPVRRNIDLLSTFRDNAIHFYNERGFNAVVYGLAQTSIINFKDLLKALFGQDLSKDINWSLLPLGMAAPIDPIQYIGGKRPPGDTTSNAVRLELKEAADEVQNAGKDTGRL